MATAAQMAVAKPVPPIPVAAECPVRCLGLSQHSYRPLIRAAGLYADPPTTVGDVLKLARDERLGDITGIGRGRVAEIENALRTAGFDVHHDHRPPGGQPPAP